VKRRLKRPPFLYRFEILKKRITGGGKTVDTSKQWVGIVDGKTLAHQPLILISSD
jgi:hypothetical protein